VLAEPTSHPTEETTTTTTERKKEEKRHGGFQPANEQNRPAAPHSKATDGSTHAKERVDYPYLIECINTFVY